jgi:hypothetical protein
VHPETSKIVIEPDSRNSKMIHVFKPFNLGLAALLKPVEIKYKFWCRDVAMQRLYIGFEITRNHFRALNSATP